MWKERRQDSSNTQKTIYVKGNDLERDSLRDTFEKYGNIRRINVAERQRYEKRQKQKNSIQTRVYRVQSRRRGGNGCQRGVLRKVSEVLAVSDE